MLTGEDNAEQRWKSTIGLISKKETLHVQHTFLYISLPLICTTTTWNVLGGVYMRKLAPARVAYRHDFLISYRF